MSFVYEDISDLSYVKHITLDLSGGVSHKFVSAKQGDINSRYLGISLTANDVPIEIPSDIIPRIRATKPDGNCVFNDGDLHDNKIYIELTDQILAVSGTVKCDIGMYRGDDVLSSATFFLEVAERPLDEDRLKSSGEFLSLEKYVQEAKEAAEKAKGVTVFSGNEFLVTGTAIGVHKAKSSDPLYSAKIGDVYINTENLHSYTIIGVYDGLGSKDIHYINQNALVDYEYDPESLEAQSGKAVAAAIEESVGQINSVLATLVEVEEV